MDSKKVSITGLNNKYQMKKLLQENKEEKQRTVTSLWDISEDIYVFSKQQELIKNMHLKIIEKKNLNDIFVIIHKEIERKIYGYRQQDLIKNILNPDMFITIFFIIEKLLECQMKCYYCCGEMLILYKKVREPTQWTVDRINNFNGHNNNNIVLSCLECNLKRRNKNKDSFLFTKQLKIIRENFTENTDDNNI
jgi:hypothetical protein